ncbi:MAG: hypothetical protein K5886_11545 [Lachnospiraceae bacterium]|nr:hypothetical protein [Lachnospiraceae bacterium]
MNRTEELINILKELMQSRGVEVKDRKKGQFYFNLHLTEKMRNTEIEALDLSVRPYHNLKRAGIRTIGELADLIASGAELRRIRNNGATSVKEIMACLFLYQYNLLNPDKRDEFLIETAKINKLKKEKID